MIHAFHGGDNRMRFHRSLDLLFSDPSHLRVLRALWKNSAERLTGREVASRARVSTAQTARVLHDLQDAGIVTSQAAGRAFVWRWNAENVWALSIRRLFEEEERVPANLVGELSRMLKDLPIEKAHLFGSIPRGQERSDSDIDLFVETPNVEASEKVRTHLDLAREALWRKYGNPLSPLVMTSQEVRRSSTSGLFKTITTEGIPLRE
jgi:predicted nucleotidyltransferase